MFHANPEVVAPSRARIFKVLFGDTLGAMDAMEPIWANSAQKGARIVGLKVSTNIHIQRTLFQVELKLLNNRFRK